MCKMRALPVLETSYILSCDDNLSASLPQPLIKPAAEPAPNTLINSLRVKAITFSLI